MTAAAIIARGGSRRLPRKNALEFCGHPLVAWSIIQARAAKLVDKVYLSTDDDEIESIGWAYGAEVIRRPDWPDADQVAANRVYLHMLDVLEERGEWPDVFMSMFPTSPLRKPGDLDLALAHHAKTGFHVYPCARKRETFLLKDILGIKAKLVIADKSYSYLEGNSGLCNVTEGNWYRWHTKALTEAVGDHDAEIDERNQDDVFEMPDTDTYFVECEPWQLVETDTLEEFRLAEALMQHYILQGRTAQEVYGVSMPIRAGNWRQQ